MSVGKRILIRDIQRAVAERHHVSMKSMKGSRGNKQQIRSRHTAIYLARRLTGHSLNTIGYHFGGRDHTTIRHAYLRVQDRIRRNQKTRIAVAALIDELTKDSVSFQPVMHQVVDNCHDRAFFNSPASA